MKHIILLFLVVVLYSCVDSNRINDDEFGFSITFPTKPNFAKSAIEKSSSIENSIKYESIIKNNDSLKYSIECFKISKFYYQKHPDRLERIVKSIVLDILFDPKSIIANEIKYYSTYQGFQFTYKEAENRFQTIRAFLINDNLYVMSYICPSAKLHDMSLAHFFDSFELKDIKNNTTTSSNFKPYSISFNRPTKQESTQRMTQNYGKLVVNVEMGELQENDKNLVLGIVYCKLPISSDSTSQSALDLLFDEFINGAINSLPAKLIEEKDIKYLSDYHGRQIKMLWHVNNSNIIIKIRYYLIKNYLYGLQVYHLEGKENEQETNDFYNSFRPIFEK